MGAQREFRQWVSLTCGAANLGRSRLIRRPEPAESRLRAELPAPQVKLTHYQNFVLATKRSCRCHPANAGARVF